MFQSSAHPMLKLQTLEKKKRNIKDNCCWNSLFLGTEITSEEQIDTIFKLRSLADMFPFHPFWQSCEFGSGVRDFKPHDEREVRYACWNAFWFSAPVIKYQKNIFIFIYDLSFSSHSTNILLSFVKPITLSLY